MNPTLLGLAVGDVFGAPFEHNPHAPEHAVRSAREQRYLRSVEDVQAPWKWIRTEGLYTDDTQQALMLLRIYRQMEAQGVDPTDGEGAGRRFLALAKNMWNFTDTDGSKKILHRGYGSSFRAAVTWRSVNSLGTGQAMRIAPAAVLIEDPKRVIPWAMKLSSATSSAYMGQVGAALIATEAWKAANDPTYQFEIPQAKDSRAGECWFTLRVAQSLLQHGGLNALQECLDKPVGSGLVVSDIPWILQCVSEDLPFLDTLVKLCSVGGDTDTLCAIGGALMGAANKLPDSWMIEGLQPAVREIVLDPDSWNPQSEVQFWQMDQDLRQKNAVSAYTETDKGVTNGQEPSSDHQCS